MTAPSAADGADGGSQADWIDEVRAALERRLAHPVPAPLERDVDALIDLIDRGRDQLDDHEALTRATAEGIGGAVYELIAMSFTRGGEANLPGLLPQLMFFVIRPYLGVEPALAEFHRPRIERPRAVGRGGS